MENWLVEAYRHILQLPDMVWIYPSLGQSLVWTFQILLAPALYRARYSRHQRRWVGNPSSQLGDDVFSAFTSTITINAFSNSITILSEKIWIKNTLLYLHSGLFSLDSALVPFLFGSPLPCELPESYFLLIRQKEHTMTLWY